LDPAQDLFYAMVSLWLPSTSLESELFPHQGKEAGKVGCKQKKARKAGNAGYKDHAEPEG